MTKTLPSKGFFLLYVLFTLTETGDKQGAPIYHHTGRINIHDAFKV